MNVSIQPAIAEDFDELAEIQKQAFKRLYEIYKDEGSPYLRGAEELILWSEHPNWRVYKIIVDKALRGGIAFCERIDMPGVYYLARVYILPEYQSKGIASTAIQLCENTIYNATLWKLDYPADQIANRRCYEKAGYTDTGELYEQSNGAITLAYMEKAVPPFRDVKDHLDNNEIQKVLALCVFDSSPEGMSKSIAAYKERNSRQFYGWVENGEMLGICGFEVHSDFVEILHVAVSEKAQRHGIGGKIINELMQKYGMSIEAETDDDAVGFYRKCGFNTTAFQKHSVRRWTCVLSV